MAASNAAGIHLPPTAVRQLETLIRYIGRLPDVIRESDNISYGITVFQVLEPLSRKLNIPFDHLADIFYALENLRQLAAEFGSTENALARILADVNQDVRKQLDEQKDRIKDTIAIYKDDNPVAVTFKTQKLAYSYERIYRDAEIITDVRPIFDAAGRRVLQVIVGQKLILSMAAVGTSERISVAMDAGDVVKLRASCDRAIEKARSLSSVLTESGLKCKVQILRGEDDGIT